MLRFSPIFCLAGVAASCLLAQTTPNPPAVPMPADPSAILQLAQEQNDIDVDGIKPWHLKATFQLFDEKGKPTETATLDEIWAGPKQQKRTWSSPSFTQVEIVNQDGTFRSGSKDEVLPLLEQARRTIVHPMPSEYDIAGTQPVKQKKRFGKVDLNCVMLSQPLKGLDDPLRVFGLFPTYCFGMDNPSYRIGFNYGDTAYIAGTIGKFQGRFVAVKDYIRVNDMIRVQGSVDDLRTVTDSDIPAFTLPPDATNISDKSVRVAAGVAAGHRINGPDPVYPAAAKENHIQGTVVLKAIIGRDGHIHSLRIVSANDPDLAVSAIAAVRHWIYTPYLLNGSATEVDTQITVNFKMGF